jgi:outer membrane protein
MKWLMVPILTLAATLPAGAQSAGGANPKIGVIDVQRLVQESAMGKEAFARVKRLNDQKTEQAANMQKDLADLEKKLADQGPSMTEDKRDELQKQYQEKAVAFKRFQDDAQRAVTEAQEKELREIERRVIPVIAQIGKEHGYAVIFNKFSQGNILYAADSIDITDEVIRQFNTSIVTPETPAKTPAGKTEKKEPPKTPTVKH